MLQTTSTDRDNELVKEFMVDYATMNQLSKGSTDKYHYATKIILRWLHEIGATIETMSDSQALQLIQKLQSSKLSEATRKDYWKRWKKVIGWLHDKKGLGNSEALARIQQYVYHKDKNKETRKNIVTESEMLRIVHSEPHLCYKVAWAVIYEGGLRIGEALALRIGDVTRSGAGYVVKLRKSKTDKRTIHLYGWCTNHVQQWLSFHPYKDDKEAALFLNARNEPLEYRSAAYHLQDAVGYAKIDKHITPHSLRHSRASHLANHLTEAQLCKFFGWRQGSDMPSTYIRENAIDLEHAMKRVNGIEDEQEKREAGVRCNWCGQRNPEEAKYCDHCHKSMDLDSQVRAADELASMERLIMQLMERKYGARINAMLQD